MQLLKKDSFLTSICYISKYEIDIRRTEIAAKRKHETQFEEKDDDPLPHFSRSLSSRFCTVDTALYVPYCALFFPSQNCVINISFAASNSL